MKVSLIVLLLPFLRSNRIGEKLLVIVVLASRLEVLLGSHYYRGHDWSFSLRILALSSLGVFAMFNAIYIDNEEPVFVQYRQYTAANIVWFADALFS